MNVFSGFLIVSTSPGSSIDRVVKNLKKLIVDVLLYLECSVGSYGVYTLIDFVTYFTIKESSYYVTMKDKKLR